MANPMAGSAMTQTDTGSLTGAVRWWITYTDATYNQDVDNQFWEGKPGSRMAVRLLTGSTPTLPPASADRLIIELRDASDTLIRTLYDGDEAGFVGSIDFWFTDDGTETGQPRAGGLELYVRAIRNTGTGGVGDYDVDSRGVTRNGSISTFWRGIFRSNLEISDISVTPYPAGDTFAYGSAGDEQFTVTATHTQPYVVGEGQVEIQILDGTDEFLSSGTLALTGTQTQFTDTVKLPYKAEAASYGVGIKPVGDLFITPRTGVKSWARCMATGANTEAFGLDADVSDHRRTVSVRGNPTLVPSPWAGYGNAIQLDGVDNNADTDGLVTEELAWDMSAPFVLEAKVQVPAATTGEIMLSLCSVESRTPEIAQWGTLAYINTSGDWSIVDYENGATKIVGDVPVVAGTYDVALVYDGSKTYLFVDGVEVASRTRTAFGAARYAATIGRFHYTRPSTPNPYPFTGIIDEVRFSSGTTRGYVGGYTPATVPFSPDANTELLLQFNETNATGAARRQSFFDIDPRVILDTLTPTQTLYNRGEATTAVIGLNNARGEPLIRSVTFDLKNSSGTSVDTQNLTGPDYTLNYTLPANADAAYDLVGNQWAVTASYAGEAPENDADAFKVSSQLVMSLPVSDESIYNRGEAPLLGYSLTYARGDAYANQASVTTEVLNLGSAVESSTTVSTDANGAVAYAYTIGVSDTATADDVGSPKRVQVSHNGNSTDPSTSVWSVSSLYYVDLHTQKIGTLAKDDFPTDDANEHYAFVILGDVAYTWVHVEGVRLDGTEIETNGSAITLTIADPDGGIQDTRVLDTGADGWSSRLNINPTAPAGDWGYTVDVSFTGNTGTDSETITYITPLTSNLETPLQGPALCKPGQTVRVYLQTEIDDAPADPQQQPVLRIEDLATGVTVMAEADMLNVVDDTNTINGARYYYEFVAPTTQGRYAIVTRAQLNGNGVRRSQVFRVAADQFDPTGLFAGP